MHKFRVDIFELVFEWAIAVASPCRSATGENLAAICRDAGIPSRATIFRWIARYKEYHDEYTLACELRTSVHGGLPKKASHDCHRMPYLRAPSEIKTRKLNFVIDILRASHC